jgi:hypothetical protein
MSSSFLAIMSVTIGVSIVPGQTALIRIPRGAYSKAALVVSQITPCFEAWCVVRPGSPILEPCCLGISLVDDEGLDQGIQWAGNN